MLPRFSTVQGFEFHRSIGGGGPGIVPRALQQGRREDHAGAGMDGDPRMPQTKPVKMEVLLSIFWSTWGLVDGVYHSSLDERFFVGLK